MKSSQERSNECLLPKKREIPVTSLPSEEKTAAPASESQRVDNVCWSPSISSIQSSPGSRHSNTTTLEETDLQQGIVLHKSLAADYSSPSAPRSTSAMQSSAYPPALTQSGATLSPAHYTHLQHPFQFAQYGAPFAAIVPSELVSPTANSTSGAVTSTSSASATATTPSQRSQLEAYSTMLTSMGNVTQQSHKVEQHLCRPPGLVTAGSPTATSPAPQNQFVRVSSSPLSVSRTVSSPASQLHPHSAVIPHNLTSQVVLQYADSGSHCYTREGHKKAEDSRLQVKEILNGEIEKSRRYGISPSAGTNLKTGNKAASHHYEARHLVVHPSPSDYSAHNSSGVRTSVMVVPNSNSFAMDLEVHHAIKRDTSPSAVHEKVGINLGKVGSRPYALSPQQTLGHEGVKTIANLSPHTVIQTTHNASEHLPVGLSPTAFYTSTQHPVIGYLSSQQSAVGYHGNLSHLVIPGAQPFLIPLSRGDVEASGVASAIVTSSPHYAAVPHTFVSTAIPKTENFSHEAVTTQPAYQAAVLQAQIHLPVAQPASSPTAASPALPPYFMKGSIIQLANGELKKVEDLKTEDFIQSAEISNELKIDSSTVERIEESHNPGFAVIQFAVGEHRTQVL
ncbi:ataxin-1 [Protopterus annectens]|uniref:ataxin-1 n=1 Tax=Protopterus annectens TaxID=7888 RepID=UPI001CFBA432|nr:ataxin-1 [Protopterus annectens]